MSGLPAGHDTQAAFAAVLVDEWLRAGLSDAVVAPGSRSTPLLVALAERAERGHLRLHVVLDERSAGFLALGLGRASGRPALVVTTSGTAAAELHPAVQEADQGGVPMVAVTADRPPELHDCGAPQTAPQVGLFGGAPRWQLSPGPPDLAAASAWRPMASRAVAEALGGLRPPGPVHLNLAFREPLLGSAGAVLEAGPGGPVHAAVAHGRADGAAWHRVPPPAPVVPPADVIELLSRASRGLIVAGWGVGDPSAVWSLAEASGWPVLAEPISGCRQPGAIGTADALLRTELVRGWEPDVVLRLGAPWLSRALNEWLAGLTCPQILADPWGRWAAPDRQPSVVVQASPDDVCRAVATAVPASGRGPRTGWSERWSMAEQLAQEAIGAALAQEAELNEPA
ncbi:MAG TPA: 2-succinyl-5-enolpyruvyl-6-hydroxy-3-cyclohexene-1-carboxylic-acid synthase, partial [Acidimicrobiales bacterium]|nr:2-succinyl-5-enolpyruvyl-6-hydroxy-3-cyclohexene-1-carboxylic-acid synthase [Acidimicrobiales bacterium]